MSLHNSIYLLSSYQSKGVDILKEFNLQDMLISPDFADFVNWFSQLTEENQLTADDVLKYTMQSKFRSPIFYWSFCRSNEMKAAGTFNGDMQSVNKTIEQIVGKSLNDSDIEDLQDEFDDLCDSREALDNMLASAK